MSNAPNQPQSVSTTARPTAKLPAHAPIKPGVRPNRCTCDWDIDPRMLLSDKQEKNRLHFIRQLIGKNPIVTTLTWAAALALGKVKPKAKTAEEMEEIEKQCQLVDKTGSVFTSDRYKLAVLIRAEKDAAINLATKKHVNIGGILGTAIEKLYHRDDPAITPIMPTVKGLDTDSRHKNHAERAALFAADKFGCTYYIVQQTTGFPDKICANKHILGADTGVGVAFHRSRKVAEFFKEIGPNLTAAGLIFKAVDPESYELYKRVYEKIHSTIGGLANIYNRAAAWVSMVIITNMAVEPHRDRKDRLDGWVMTQTLGDWTEGGLVVCPDLMLKFVQRPGDILLLRSALMEHWVTEWKGGMRRSVVYWTHAGLFRFTGQLSSQEQDALDGVDDVEDLVDGLDARAPIDYALLSREVEDEGQLKQRKNKGSRNNKAAPAKKARKTAPTAKKPRKTAPTATENSTDSTLHLALEQIDLESASDPGSDNDSDAGSVKWVNPDGDDESDEEDDMIDEDDLVNCIHVCR